MSSTIRYMPTLPIMFNGAIGTIVTGTPGSGKTYFLLNVMANCIAMGQNIIGIDPKNDFERIRNIYPNVRIVDINKIHEGALNPFKLIDNCDAVTILTLTEIICGKLSQDDIIAITPIISDFIKESKRSDYVDLLDFADYLYANENPASQKIGSLLKMNSETQYGKLLFTRNRDVKPLELDRNSSFIISLFGMTFPEYGKGVDNFTQEERFTCAIMYLICKKLNSILTSRTKIPTTLFIDEAHIAYTSQELTSIIDRFLVLGRSLNIAVVLASQGITHFPDNISQYMSYKFMFKSSLNEADKFLRAFDTSQISLENSLDINSLKMTAPNLKVGQCVFLDHLSRGGIIKITSNYDKDAFNSNPISNVQS